MISEQIIKNVKTVNETVEYMQKYLNEHSKEVYQVNIDPQGFEEGHVKFTIVFNPHDSMLKEAQKQILEEK